MFTKTPFAPGTEGVWLNLPAEVYHRAPGVSQSTLKEFGEYASPLHYKARKKKVATADMEFGTICHTAVLEPGNLDKAYYIQPEKYPAVIKGKKGEPDSTIAKDWHNGADWCKDWVREHDDRPIIDKEREADIPIIVKRVSALPEFGSALKHGQREVSFFKLDEATGLLLKCRVDVWAVQSDGDYDGVKWIFDLKKVQSGGASREEFSRSIADFGYHIQAASYMHITGAAHFVFVPFDDAEPFDACQWEIEQADLDAGAFEYRRLLNEFAVCLKSDLWTGYRGGIDKIGLPAYAKKKSTQAQHDAWLAQVAAGGAL
jgi:hypothetical protein